MSERLRISGVRSILLKGPSVARWLYDAAGERPYGDTDFLISPSDSARAGEILGGIGFVTHHLTGVPHEAMSHAQLWLRGGAAGAAVDLHTRIPGVGVAPDRMWGVLTSHTTTMDVAGAQVEVLDEPARLVHVLLHAGHHSPEGGRPLADLCRAVERVPFGTWRSACHIAERLDAVTSFAAGLRRAPEGIELARRLNLPTGRSREVVLREVGASSIAHTLNWALDRRGIADKTRVIWWEVFPPREFIESRYPKARGSTVGLIVGYARRLVYIARGVIPALRDLMAAARAAKRSTRDRDGRAE